MNYLDIIMNRVILYLISSCNDNLLSKKDGKIKSWDSKKELHLLKTGATADGSEMSCG